MDSTRAWQKRFLTAALAVVALLALPAVSNAAVNFGSRLNHEPTESNCAQTTPPCTTVGYIHPSDPNGDPYSGGAPIDGVITKFRVQADGGLQTATLTLRLANVTPDPNNNSTAIATAAGTGPTVTVAPYNGIETPISEFPARLTVKKGNHLAIDGSDVNIVNNSNGSKFSYSFAPPLVEGQGPRGSSASANELMVAATIEPDADNDGFGDETQDKCLNQNGAADGCDKVQPTLTITGSAKQKLKKLAITVTTNEAATVNITGAVKLGKAKAKKSAKIKSRTISQAVSGNTATKLKVKLTKKNSKKVLRRIKARGKASIKITAFATDAAGNKSAVQTKTFKLKK